MSTLEPNSWLGISNENKCSREESWAAKKNRVSVVCTVNFLVWYVNNDCVVVVVVGGGRG